MQRIQALFRRQPKTAAVKPASLPRPLAPADLQHVAGGLPHCPPTTPGRAAEPSALPETKA
jgi:hypothetical protein